MAWQYNLHKDINLFVKNKILQADATRQEKTAAEILNRLASQPGLVLADEVGTGKSYVALAVAVSVALQDTKNRPVVVMVPPSIADKWVREFEVFKENCISPVIGKKLRSKIALNRYDFLKLLDDSDDKRSHLIFLTHGSLNRESTNDKWAKIALIQRALYRRREVDDVYASLYKNLGKILYMEHYDRKFPGIWEKVLNTDPSNWSKILFKSGLANEDFDDPVPELFASKISEMSSAEYNVILEILKKNLPRRNCANFDTYIGNTRNYMNGLIKQLWPKILSGLKIQLPLLVLDEAHHLKNSETRFASLFRTADSNSDADTLQNGFLSGVFERMLFMTATPFQLGHHELCNVLDRFNGIAWEKSFEPSEGKINYQNILITLRESLDKCQESALRFDKSWGKLESDDLKIGDKRFIDVKQWWEEVKRSDKIDNPIVIELVKRYNDTFNKIKNTEILIKPFVIRHNKPKQIITNGNIISRRNYFPGRSIIDEAVESEISGLDIQKEALLPFLMAARLTVCTPETRPVFAEGLASSYEAFRYTRQRREKEATDTDDDQNNGKSSETIENDSITRQKWYLDHIDKFLKSNLNNDTSTHPKISSTLNKAIDLWRNGEKVIIFCHYIETGKALRLYISDALRTEIEKNAAKKLKCTTSDVWDKLERIATHFENEKYRLRQVCDIEIGKLVQGFPKLKEQTDKLVDIIRRYLRTPSFLVRFFPLGSNSLKDDAFFKALDTKDGSGLTLREIILEFFRFLQDRCGEKERENYIDALLKLQSGNIRGKDILTTYSGDEDDKSTPDVSLPTVRLVNGKTAPESRKKLMLTFNTPFYPDILVASSVLAEGVDLQLNCRHVIHHDLCWNPSTLEQRTGRVDRIGAKAEKCGHPIKVYLPYISETQDEKMYRVVMDRERWFKIVMGEKYIQDTKTTDKLASRIMLPEEIADTLSFDLRV